LLEPAQIEELKQMAALLPHLVQNFEMAEREKEKAAEPTPAAAEDVRIFPVL
jgi:hypothetical protein